MAVKIKHKRGTAANIGSANPTLASGELGFETDTLRFKLGDGTTAWDSLAYVKPYVSTTDRLLGRSTAGAGVVEEITCTAFGRSLIDDADAAAARTTLGVQPTASPTFTGNARVNSSDSATSLLVNGATKGVRFATSSTATAIEGVDSTGTGSYQPLIINGSTVTIQSNGGTSAITVSTSQSATFAGQVLVTAGSGSSGSYKPGLAISGDDDTGVQQVGGANTLSIVTDSLERVRVDASGNVLIGAQGGGLVVATPLHLQLGNQFASTAGDAAKSKLRFFEDTSGNIYGFGVSSALFETHAPSGAALATYVGNAERFRISSGGTITAAQVYSDTVGATNRDLFIDNTGKFGYVSSIRASKTNIDAIEDVSWLRDLTPVSFHYRKRNEDGTYTDDPDGTLDYGLIAEDVEPVAPELCFYDVVDGEPQLRGVHYSKLITPMLRYIQQLEQRIAALEERLNHA